MPIGKDPTKVFELVERVGSGSYGDVYKAKLRENGELAAVKVIILDVNEQLDEINNEIEILKKCNHVNVVKYLGYYERAGKQPGQKQIWVRSRKIGPRCTLPARLGLTRAFRLHALSRPVRQIGMEYCSGGSVEGVYKRKGICGARGPRNPRAAS